MGTCLVEALLLMARSSVVPGGGTSPESSLYILRQCRGDFLVRTHWRCCCCSSSRCCCCCCCLSPHEDELRFGFCLSAGSWEVAVDSWNQQQQQPRRPTAQTYTPTHLYHRCLLQQYCDNVPDIVYHLASNVIAEVSWSEAEKRLLVKSLQLHQKDFSRIQKAVRFLRVEVPPQVLQACSHVFVCSGSDQVRLWVCGVLLSVEEEDERQLKRTDHQPWDLF